MFTYLHALRKHQKKCKGKPPPCQDHSHAESFVHHEFDTLDSAKDWVKSMELDRQFCIGSSKPNWIQYQCRRHLAKKPNRSPKKSQGKRKIAKTAYVPCPAKFTISMTHVCRCTTTKDQNGAVCLDHRRVYSLRGCLAHSHEEEIKYQRISKIVKEKLISLLRAGVPKSIIIERYCSQDTYKNVDSKLLTMQDLRNLERKFGNNGIDLTKSDIENLCEILEEDGFRGFSFDDLKCAEVPERIVGKTIRDCKKSMIVYASDFMLDQFHKHPGTLFVDGTHGTNRSKYSLITLLVAGKLHFKSCKSDQ